MENLIRAESRNLPGQGPIRITDAGQGCAEPLPLASQWC